MTLTETPPAVAPSRARALASQVNATLTSQVNATLAVCLLLFISFLLPANPLSQLLVLAGLPFVVGSTCAVPLRLSDRPLAFRLVVSLALGLLAMFVVGAVVGYVLPHLGLDSPLTGDTVKVLWSAILVAIGVVALARREDPVRTSLDGARLHDLGWAAVLAVPPVLALVGVARLNANGSGTLAIVVGFLAVAMAVLAVALPKLAAGPPRVLLLASSLVTAAWQGPMRGGFLFIGDIQHEYYVGQLGITQGAFPIVHDRDAYAGMLSLTVWPAQIFGLSGLSLRVLLALVPSVVLGLCVVMSWATIREWVEPRAAAALCALVLLGSYSILREMPGVSRECYALLFFTVLVYAVTSRTIDARAARILAALAGLGMAFSHYSSAYIAAACVVGAWLFALVVRQPRATRVLTFPVTATIAAAAGIWGAFVARTGTNFSLTWNSLSSQGFQFLPGGGNPISRWLHGANISKLVSATVIRQSDLALRRTAYRWMHVDPKATAVPFRDASLPRSPGLHVVGPAVGAASVLVTELVLVLAVLSVLVCLWHCRADRRLSELSALAAVGVVVAGISRSSATLAVQFGPTRVQLQVYMVFISTMAVSLTLLQARAHLSRTVRAVAIGVCAAAAGVAVMASSLLTSVVEHNAQLVSYYSNRGDQVSRIPTPADLSAAQWLAMQRPNEVLQGDWDAQYVMNAFGFWPGRGFVPSIDPVLTDEHAWLLATRTNVVQGIARGGNSSETGIFRYPRAYLSATRPALYVSPTDVVYGSNVLAFNPVPPSAPSAPSAGAGR